MAASVSARVCSKTRTRVSKASVLSNVFKIISSTPEFEFHDLKDYLGDHPHISGMSLQSTPGVQYEPATVNPIGRVYS